jgi:capsular exopolysaccharide synthesis family protein
LDLAVWTHRHSLTAETYRNATYSVLLAGESANRAKVYVISSPNLGEGKTTVACNLALALTQANRRILLIDGDLRRPRLHRALGVENKVGLRDVLRGEFDVDKQPLSSFYKSTTSPNLCLLPAGLGDEEPSSLLHSPRMASLLRSVSRDFDFVLIDTPPALHMADARILAGLSDGVILVFRARSTGRTTAMQTRDLFLNDRVKVLGTILNDFDPAKEGQRSYYRSYYRYQEDAVSESYDEPELVKPA